MFSATKSRPSWYYRVNGLLRDRFLRGETDLWEDHADARPEDYDEDLSEVSTFSCASRNGCDYGTEDICEYHRKLDEEGRDSDNELDRNDPYDLKYLDMKMDRRDRKRELRAQKKWDEEMRKKREKYTEQMNEEKRKEAQKFKVYEDAEKAGDIWRERRKEIRPWKTHEGVATKDDIGPVIHYINEIRDALDRVISLEETPTPLNLGLMRIFKLWSFDHIKHFHYEVAPKMSIKFSSKFDGAKLNEEHIRTIRAKKLSGYIHLLSDTAFDLGKFTPPEYCSTKTHNLGSNQEPVYIQFFNDNYLTLKIRRETTFSNWDIDDIPWNAPSLFTYYGISERYMVDKEKQEEEEWETEEESVIE